MSQTVLVINFLVGVLIPAIVALVTSKLASSRYKALLLLLLAAVTGTLTNVAHTGSFQWRTIILSIAATFITSITAHYGFLKPAGVTGSQGVIQQKVSAGLGAPAEYVGKHEKAA